MSVKSTLVVPAVIAFGLCGVLLEARTAHASRAPCGPPITSFGAPPTETGQAETESPDEPPAVQGDQGGRAPASDGALSTASRGIARAEPSEGSDEDEYNFSWLDPDKKVYVLQNRKYRKKGRVALFVSGGFNLSNAYQTEYEAVPRAAYWLSEQFGFEVFYGSVSNRDNSNLTALQSVSASALPFVRQNRSYYGGLVTWTPWYAKLNFFNKILYFDWTFNAGGGQTATFVNQSTKAGQAPNYLEQDLGTIFYGTDLMFYVTKNFLVRFDLIGMMYNATGPDNVTKSYIQNYEFTAGIGWAF